MNRLLGLAAIAALVLAGCGGGGGGIGTPAHAVLPTALNAGVTKDVLIYSGQLNIHSIQGFTGEITVDGNTITFTENGKNRVFVGATMSAIER